MYLIQCIALLRQLLFLLLAIVLLAGCSTHNLRVAQDKFEEGSMQEWMMRNDPASNTGAASLLPATRPHTMYYREALVLVDENINKHKDDLVKDNLYCTALVLKALCHWKLNESGKLDETIEKAQEHRNDFLTEQWQLLILSKNFLKADYVATLVRRHDADLDIPLATYTEIRNILFDDTDSVDTSIRYALTKQVIANNLPLTRYLVLARITIHKNYITACKYLARKTPEQLKSQIEKEKELSKLLTELKKLSTTE